MPGPGEPHPSRVHPPMHGSLPWLGPEDVEGAARDLYERITTGPRSVDAPAFVLTDAEGRLEGPFNAMLFTPAVGTALQDLGATLRFGATLDDRSREIGTLAVAAACRSDFEWYAHERSGRQARLTDEELAHLFRGEAAPSFSDTEEAVHRLAVQLLTDRHPSPADRGAFESVLGLGGMMEVIVLVGYYQLLDLVLRSWDTPLPAGVASPWGDVAPPV